VQPLKICLQILLVARDCYVVDSRTCSAPLPPVCPCERCDIDVMKQRREPSLARPSGRCIHTHEVRL
jgi:hypothetical protein